MKRNNEHSQPIGGRNGECGCRKSESGESRDEIWTEKLKKNRKVMDVEAHKRIWHSHCQGESCCGGGGGGASTIMKFSLGEEISLQERGILLLPSLTSSWRRERRQRPQKEKKILWPRIVGGMRLLPIGVVFFLFFLCLGMMPGSVGGTEDWTLQCPTGCKCTWVSGKKTADCRASQWTTIPSGLSPEVQVLEMGGATIKSLPKDAFKAVGLVNLQKVFLQNCRIERIDSNAFRDLTIMIELDLSGNLVSSIEMESFESNVRLRELKLSKNPLTKLTGLSFPPLMYLKLLDLSDCHLSTLPRKAFEKLSVLETLALSGNRFTFLSKELLKPLIKLKSLLLSGNPWRCDCRLKSLRDWVIEKNLFQHHTRCAEPAIVSNFAWDQLISPDFACRPEIVSVQINGKSTPALLVHTEVGSDITLQCLVRGNPPPDLKWVRDGQVLTNTSRSYGKSYYLHIGEEGWDSESDSANTEYRGRWVNLTIQKTDPEDAGEYTCVGSNSGGVVEKNLTLNFNDVPSGAGVGHGLGGLGGGSYRDTGWIWILIITLAVLVLATTLVSIVCFCSRRRRVKTTRGQDIKGEGREDLQPHQRQLLLTPTSGRNGSEHKLDDDGTAMLIMKEKYLHVTPDTRSRSQSADILSPYNTENGSLYSNHRPSSALQMIPPNPPSSALTGGPHNGPTSGEYPPDLLDLPHNTRFQDSPAPSSTVSTLPDSTRMLITPQQLNPAILVNPSRLGYNNNNNHHPHSIYSTPGGRPMSPFGLPFSPTEPAHVPVGARPGYVTLPRRHRVPSWSPSTNFGEPASSPMGPPSPTGSAATISLPFVKVRNIKYDNLGPRTTADGSSRLSLNNLPENGGSSAPGTPSNFHPHQNHHPYHGGPVGGTLGRHNLLRSTPTTPSSMLGQPISNFPPIQEVEPITSPDQEVEASATNGFGDDKNTPNKQQPSTKTETPTKRGSGGQSPSKKVPPKPPPKPKGKKKEEVGTTESTENGRPASSLGGGESPVINEPAAAILGDDGTEV